MELFSEFDKLKESKIIISQYLKENLNIKLIEKLKQNKDKQLKSLYGSNEIISKFVLKPFNPFSFKDYELLKSLLQNSYIMKTTTIFNGGTATEKQAIKNFLLKSISQPLFDIGMYNIFIDDKFAGCVGSNVVGIKDQKPVNISLAIYLNRVFQCKGLAVSTLNLIIKDIKNKYPDVFIWSTTKLNFKPASRLNKKIGMIHKGQKEKYNKGFLVDYYEFEGNAKNS